MDSGGSSGSHHTEPTECVRASPGLETLNQARAATLAADTLALRFSETMDKVHRRYCISVETAERSLAHCSSTATLESSTSLLTDR